MPVETPARRSPIRREPRAPEGGRVVYHPRYEQFLRRCGVTSAASALTLGGEIVCGHPDRHVARVELRTDSVGRVVYLKREHLVGVRTRFRNARAGFGWVSRSEREAATLRALEAAGLPGPQWLAYGEDATGRAFLLVDELADSADLRTVLGDGRLSPVERTALADRAGRAVAELHAAGFGTPELAAKHLFVNPRSRAVTLIDWQSAGRPAPVPLADRVRQLAGLHASLGPELATPRDRLRFVRAYHDDAGAETPRFGDFVRAVVRATSKIATRPSVRDQLGRPTPHLVWLAGESVCAVPEVAAVWPDPAVAAPFYSESPPGDEWVAFPGGLQARLTRFRTVDPAGRLVAVLREKPWRSPAANAARLLFHLARAGITAPKLLAFGQRSTSAVAADSFVLYEMPAGAVPWAEGLAQWTPGSRVRRLLIAECGALLRRVHDAGCRVVPGERGVFGIRREPNPGVVIVSPFAVRLARRVNDSACKADLRAVLNRDIAGLNRTNRCRLVRGYLGPVSTRLDRKALLAAVRTA